MTLGEKKLVALNIALSDKPYALIGDEKLSLAEAKLHGVIEYIEQTGLPLCKLLIRLEDQCPIVTCAVFEMSPDNLSGIAIDANRQFRFASQTQTTKARRFTCPVPAFPL